MKRKKTREKRLHLNRHPAHGYCSLCHRFGRKSRQGNRPARSAALKIGRYEDVEGFKFEGDLFNYSHCGYNGYHGKDEKSNRHHDGTRRREIYRQARRRKIQYNRGRQWAAGK